MENKKYWKGIEELENSESFQKVKHNEFPEPLPIGDLADEKILEANAPRRDFLKALGFSLTAATVAAGCEFPVRKAIPYISKPEEITPGVANYYASTFFDEGDYCSILVKTREGRPIKIEGNSKSSISNGGTSARVQGSVLSLYDETRLSGPRIAGKESDWKQIDEEITKELTAIQNAGGKIAIVSPSLASPSTKDVILKFTEKYPNTTHVVYDPISYSGMLEANAYSFGEEKIPSYNFDKAHVIVSFGADFLGNWLSPVEFTKQYVKNRKINKEKKWMSRHVHFESLMSLTGSNADNRYLMHPSEEGAYLVSLYNALASKAGIATLSGPTVNKEEVKATAEELWVNKGKSLVVSGSNDKNIQVVVNAINYLLENYGATIEMAMPLNFCQGIDAKFNDFVAAAGSYDAVILYDVNPVYNSPSSDKLSTALKKVKCLISLNGKSDETGSMAKYQCPDHFYLEAWNDANPKLHHYSLAQPTIAPLFDTRAAQESLLKWAGLDHSYYDHIKNYWKKNVFIQQSTLSSFQQFWDQSVHDGVFELAGGVQAEALDFTGDVAACASKVDAPNQDLTLVLYQKTGIGTGKYANNPWLQELPDPITKVTWDNYVTVSPKMAEANGWKQENVVSVSISGKEVQLPVVIQPGQHSNTVGIALGYGRAKGGKTKGIGKNLFGWVNTSGSNMAYTIKGVAVQKVEGKHLIAQTQMHHHINSDKRPVVRDVTLDEYKKDDYAAYATYHFDENGNKEKLKHTGKHEYDKIKKFRETTMYPQKAFKGHHWGMSIDLNSCIGCGSCVISCNAENNVPVVGKDQVYKGREMHWMRIDRYYTTKGVSDGTIRDGARVHDPDGNENPEVVYQPMLCQHCDNAPCENVCPVAATTHSTEGLNQMAYNRCVGTRYCENNCPYKVRRFNWYDYTGQDSFAWNEVIDSTYASTTRGDEYNELFKMVLNPDVTVRSRGVIEKCSFCVQRIQDGKLEAKKAGRPLQESDIKTACQTGCPSDAIQFGDLNNETTSVAKNFKDERNFHVIDEVHTMPSVGYLAKVRNKKEENNNIA